MPEKSLILVNRFFLSLFFIVCLDFFFLDGFFKGFLPESPKSIVWYYYFAGLPHIVASYVAYCNREYFTFYKKVLTRSFFINLGVLFLFIVFLPKLYIYFFIIYTMYHVSWQQIGLCRRYTENASIYRMWSFFGVVSVVCLAFSVGGESHVFIPLTLVNSLQNVAISCLVIFSVLGFYLFKEKEYPRSVTLVILFAGFSVLMGYPLIAIIMLRFTHDISAFCIYIKHDVLRLHKHKRNYLYNLFSVKPEYVYLFLPVFSIILSFLLQMKENFFFVFVALSLALNHYYLEGIVWKYGSLHRKTME